MSLFLKKLVGFKVSFVGCCHTTFVGIREPQISSTEFKAFCTECNIYREIREFKKGRFIIMKM